MKWGIHWATHGHEEEEESKRRRRRGVVSCGATRRLGVVDWAATYVTTAAAAISSENVTSQWGTQRQA